MLLPTTKFETRIQILGGILILVIPFSTTGSSSSESPTLTAFLLLTNPGLRLKEVLLSANVAVEAAVAEMVMRPMVGTVLAAVGTEVAKGLAVEFIIRDIKQIEQNSYSHTKG